MSTYSTGLFNNATDAANAIDALIVKGETPENISVLASEEIGPDAFAVETSSHIGDGAAIGAGVGGGVGAVVAGLTAVGALVATGGLGVVAAGPVVAALAGAGAGAASGGVLGGIVGAFFPEHEVKHYENAIKEGSVLVGVNKDGPLDSGEIKKVFKEFNVNKISHA